MSPTTNSSSCTIWMLRSICLSGFNGSISYRYRVSTGSKCAQSPPRYSTFYNYTCYHNKGCICRTSRK
jgi:hypothetical protein